MGQSLVVTLQLHLTTVTGSLLTEISQIVSRMFSDKLFENAFLMFFFYLLFLKNFGDDNDGGYYYWPVSVCVVLSSCLVPLQLCSCGCDMHWAF